MARRDDQQRVRPARLDAAEGLERRLVLAAQRAGGNHHRAARRQPEVAQHAIAALAVRADAGPVQRIELEAAGDDDAGGIGAERDDPPGRLLALHAEALDVVEDAAEEAAHQRVAGERALRDAAVDEHRGHAALAALAQQHRPDLGLHHHEQPRPDDVQGAADGEAPVEREVEDAVEVGQRPGHLVAGHRRRRQEQLQARVAGLELADEGARGQRLPHRHGVDPDRLVAVDVERERQVAEALAQAADVLAVAHRLVGQERRGDDQRHHAQHAVQQVHAPEE